jgi:hypothetical protein
MALFFNIEVLEAETQGDPEYLITALEHWYKGRRYKKNTKEKYKPLTKPLWGDSFILNPRELFQDRLTDINYIAQYISLAGRRDYLLYRKYGVRYLDLSFFPDIIVNLHQNPLLIPKNKQLYFKYEELQNGTLIQANQR